MQAHCLGMTEGRMRRSGGGCSHGGDPPSFLSVPSTMAQVSCKKRPSECLIYSLSYKNQIGGRRGEEMPMSTVFRVLLRGQKWFRYSNSYFSCRGHKRKGMIDGVWCSTPHANPKSATHVIMSHEQLYEYIWDYNIIKIIIQEQQNPHWNTGRINKMLFIHNEDIYGSQLWTDYIT